MNFKEILVDRNQNRINYRDYKDLSMIFILSQGSENKVAFNTNSDNSYVELSDFYQSDNIQFYAVNLDNLKKF